MTATTLIVGIGAAVVAVAALLCTIATALIAERDPTAPWAFGFGRMNDDQMFLQTTGGVVVCVMAMGVSAACLVPG